MSMHPELTLDEVADRIAIKELIDAYAHCADFRLPEQQADLYTTDGRTLVYEGSTAGEPAQVLSGRNEHVAGFRTLSQFAVTMHVNAQSTLVLDGDAATAESYCLAHHIIGAGEDRTLMVMAIRYEDTLARTPDGWRFAERKLVTTFTDTRPSQP